MEKAYVLINCELGDSEDTLDALRNMKSVSEAHETFGVYDIIAEIGNENPDELRQDISHNIRKIPSIRSTLTLMTVDEER
jgi:DNA-binding Lrp family transcriptional regulator